MRYLIILIFINLFAHPLNLTKMEINTTNHTLFMRFAIFNIYKAFHKEEFNKTELNNYILKHIKIDDCKIVPFKGFWVELDGSTKNKTVKLLIPKE